MSRQLQALGKTLRHISREVVERTPIPLGNWAYPHQPGDMIWVKDWKKEPLHPTWTGPHLGILATPTAVKVAGLAPWIHHPRVKKAAAPADPDDWQTIWDPTDPLKLKIRKMTQQPTATKGASGQA